MEKIWKSEEFVWKCAGFWKNEKYGTMMNLTEKVEEFVWKNIEMWRICMEMWRIFKEKWKIYGKNDEFVSKVKEFIWSNGILSIGSLTSTVF